MMTSSRQFSPSTGLPISAILRASSSSAVSFLSPSPAARGRDGAEGLPQSTSFLGGSPHALPSEPSSSTGLGVSLWGTELHFPAFLVVDVASYNQ